MYRGSNSEWFRRVLIVEFMQWFIYSLANPADFIFFLSINSQGFVPIPKFYCSFNTVRYHNASLFVERMSLPACILDTYFFQKTDPNITQNLW